MADFLTRPVIIIAWIVTGFFIQKEWGTFRYPYGEGGPLEAMGGIYFVAWICIVIYLAVKAHREVREKFWRLEKERIEAHARMRDTAKGGKP